MTHWRRTILSTWPSAAWRTGDNQRDIRYGWSALIAARNTAASVGRLFGSYQLQQRVKGGRGNRITGWIWVTTTQVRCHQLFGDPRATARTDQPAARPVGGHLGQPDHRHFRGTPRTVRQLRGAMRGSYFGPLSAFISAGTTAEDGWG